MCWNDSGQEGVSIVAKSGDDCGNTLCTALGTAIDGRIEQMEGIGST